MSLYKILFSHTAPKNTEFGIKCYLFANSDEDVFDWIASEPVINGKSLDMFNSWADTEPDEDGEPMVFEIYDENYNVIGEENFKEKIIRIKGEMNDEDYDFSDAYYGITLYGWEWVDDGVDADMEQKMIDLDMAYRAKS